MRAHDGDMFQEYGTEVRREPHPTPRLIAAMKFMACLSDGEAEACLRDYEAGFEYSSEAVAHYGGTTAVLKAAIRHMTRLRESGHVQ